MMAGVPYGLMALIQGRREPWSPEGLSALGQSKLMYAPGAFNPPPGDLYGAMPPGEIDPLTSPDGSYGGYANPVQQVVHRPRTSTFEVPAEPAHPQAVKPIEAVPSGEGREPPLAPMAPVAPAMPPLPTRKPFLPEGEGYDYESARAAGLGPDESGHWPSRVPDSGLLLKGRQHPTWDLLEQGEAEAGNAITQRDGRYYSHKLPDYAPGGPIPEDLSTGSNRKADTYARLLREKGELDAATRGLLR